MVYKLCNVFRSTGAIAIIFFSVNTLNCWATEYVFTAPPEVDKQVGEIPRNEEEYPLYECDSPSDAPLDSHDCTCADCESEAAESLTENELDVDEQNDLRTTD